MKPQALIDQLLEEHLPKRYYGHEARKHAKEMALEFMESARKEYARQDIINTALFLGRVLTEEEKERILKTWGFNKETVA